MMNYRGYDTMARLISIFVILRSTRHLIYLAYRCADISVKSTIGHNQALHSLASPAQIRYRITAGCYVDSRRAALRRYISSASRSNASADAYFVALRLRYHTTSSSGSAPGGAADERLRAYDDTRGIIITLFAAALPARPME